MKWLSSAKLPECANDTDHNVWLQINNHEREGRDDVLCISGYISSCKTDAEF